MKRPHGSLLAFALMPIGLLIVSSTSGLGQVLSISTKELTEESAAILIGTCTKAESYWDESGSKIFTRVKIRGSRYVKGNLGTEAEITVPGGKIGNTIYEVSDMPSFREGEEVFVFVWKHPTGKHLVTGGSQGRLVVETDKRTGKKVVKGGAAGIEAATKLEKAPLEGPQMKGTVFLEDFINEVRSYVKR